MAWSADPTLFTLMAGVILGVAQAGTTYAVIYGVIGRNVSAERRSWAMGVAAAAGSFGQFLMVPVDSRLIQWLGWQNALLVLSAAALLIIPLAFGLRESPKASSPQPGTASTQGGPQGARAAFQEALQSRDYRLLMLGYFVCGFQVVFIGVHLPAWLKDHGMAPGVATSALALIGLFNVIGTYGAGSLGQRMAKRHILAFIYLARSVVIAIFLSAPLSALSVQIFAAVMGILWLSTVPPTNALVAQIFGVRHLSMLGGMVFLSHQIGSFLGVWLGGLVYDLRGNYDWVWAMAIGLGVVAALVNLPIREAPLVRAAAA